jgi:hypothetical protein
VFLAKKMTDVKADNIWYFVVELLEIFTKIANFSATSCIFGKNVLLRCARRYVVFLVALVAEKQTDCLFFQ